MTKNAVGSAHGGEKKPRCKEIVNFFSFAFFGLSETEHASLQRVRERARSDRGRQGANQDTMITHSSIGVCRTPSPIFRDNSSYMAGPNMSEEVVGPSGGSKKRKEKSIAGKAIAPRRRTPKSGGHGVVKPMWWLSLNRPLLALWVVGEPKSQGDIILQKFDLGLLYTIQEQESILLFHIDDLGENNIDPNFLCHFAGRPVG